MKKTAKDMVIKSLMKEKGLSLRSINQKIKNEYSCNLSYHSVYKALQQLMDEAIISKKNDEYSLSEEWINEKMIFLGNLKKHLNHTKGYDFSDPSFLRFNNIREMHKFLRHLEKDHLPIFDKDQKGTVIWVVYHCYNYLLEPAKELAYIKKLKECNVDFRILCYGNTNLDVWTKNAFDKFGATMITDSKVGGLTGLNIYDDMVVEIYYGEEFLNVLNDVYTNTKTINELDLSELFEKLSNIDYTINVAVYTDKNLIKCLKERALSFFKT